LQKLNAHSNCKVCTLKSFRGFSQIAATWKIFQMDGGSSSQCVLCEVAKRYWFSRYISRNFDLG